MHKQPHQQQLQNGRSIAVAPMMDWTDRHCRYFLRTLNPDVVLYTEMITAEALHHGDCDRLLAFHEHEHPVVLQLGGSDPERMASAAVEGARYGYDEININVGCPSDRVQNGRFGACLMAKPRIVADCVAAMRAAVDVPVTVKTRIGIDEQGSYAFLRAFVDEVAAAGCQRFVVHARKAILTGLSPKENRSIPPLHYGRVYRLKQDQPDLHVTINGGVTTVDAVKTHLQRVDGVMIGREAYSNPWILAELGHAFGGHKPASRRAVIEAMLPYIDGALSDGVPLKNITRHMLGLFAGRPGARAWRRSLSELAHRPGAGLEVVEKALRALPEAAWQCRTVAQSL